MSGTNQLLCSFNNQNGISNGNFALVGGGQWTTSTVANQQITMKVGATFSNLSTYISGAIASCTTRFQTGGVNGNQVVTANATGYATDSTHSDSTSANNLVSYSFTTGFDTVTSVTIQMNTTTQYALQGSGGSTGNAFSTTTHYTSAMGGGGGSAPPTTANLNAQQLVEVAGSASYFGANVSTSTSGTGAVTFNRNASAGNGTVAPGSGQTGVFVDTTHSDSCSAADLICVQYSSSNTSGNIYAWSFSYVGSSISAQDATGSLTGATGITATNYLPFGGTIGSSLTQALTQAYVPYALTASNLRITWGNGTVTSATLVYQKNGTTGNQTVSWSGSSGSAVDSTHTDSVSATNLIGGAFTAGSGGELSSVGITLDDGSVTPGTNFNLVAASATGAAVGFSLPSLSEPLGHVSSTGAAAAFTISSPVNNPNLAAVSAIGHAAGFSVSSLLNLGAVVARGAAAPFVSTLNFLTVPITTILNTKPIPIAGVLTNSNVPMTASLENQVPLDCILTLKPIPMAAAMNNAPVPGEGSVP